MQLAYCQVTLASGKSVVVDAFSEEAAKSVALMKHGSGDPQEEVLEAVYLELPM
jgi:hypothetical protein